MKKRRWWKNEWVITLAVVAVLYATDTLVQVQAALQRVVLATGLFKPDMLADSLRVPAEPGLVVASEDGSLLSTTDLEGDVVFINAWATWCGPCLAEMPSIDNLFREYGDRVRFVMLNLDDDPEKGFAFVRDKGYAVPVYRPAGRIPSWLDVSLIPSTVVIAADGKVAGLESGMALYDSASFRSALDRLLSERQAGG